MGMKPTAHMTGLPDGSDRIAITGMACYFPEAPDIAKFWHNLTQAHNSVKEIPAQRWDWRQIHGDPKKERNKTNSKWGGFVDGIDQFDPVFFRMSAAEANFTDPQHRLFLMTVWRALEDAGYTPQALSGQNVGVYAGVSKNDYAELIEDELPSFVSTGTVHSILANRVSFLLNLRGPSMPIDTACSSALVALHYAVRDLQNGECDAAIVGGVNALLSPRMYITHAKSGMLSPEGKCKSFDASANGYVRGEGAGVVVLKRLADAQGDGDRVHALLRATAINHGGRANFLTAPNVQAQSEVVLTAMRRAGISPKDMRYIETHGTGTKLGDPIEIEALKKAYATLAEEMSEDAPIESCVLGAVKTNIGHLESAAGMAGLIKTVCVLKHQQVPPLLNFKTLNPMIDFGGSPFTLSPDAFDVTESPMCAGVSSFGMGGVNSHVIVESAPQIQSEFLNTAIDRPYAFLFSARNGKIKEQLRVYLEWFGGPGRDVALIDIAKTLAVGREILEERAAIVAQDFDALLDGIQAMICDEPTALAFGPTHPPSGDQIAIRLDTETAMASAKAWVDGGLVSTPRSDIPGEITSLPGHHFALRSCWFKPLETVSDEAIWTLEAVELQDHHVQGEPHLPGMASLRRILETQWTGSRLRLEDIYWPEPMSGEFEKEMSSLKLDFSTNQNKFEVKGPTELLCTGRISEIKSLEQEHHPVFDTSNAAGKVIEADEIYAILNDNGLTYGAAFRSLARAHVTERVLTATLVSDRAHLHATGIWDAAFQAAAVLSITNRTTGQTQFVPYHLSQIDLFGSIDAIHTFRASQLESSAQVMTFDIDGLDVDGALLVRIKGFSKRGFKLQRTTPMPPLMLYQSAWQTAPLQANDTTSVVYINRPPPHYASLGREQPIMDMVQHSGWEKLPILFFAQDPGTTDALAVLSLIKNLIAARPKSRVQVKYIAEGFEGEKLALAQALAGLARVLRREHGRIMLEVVTTPKPFTPPQLLHESGTEPSKHLSVRYDDKGQRFEMAMVNVQAGDETQDDVNSGPNTWFFAGGTGGLGHVITRHLAQHSKTRIILVGRRPLDSGIRAQMAELKELGAQAWYRQADCRSLNDVQAVVEWAEQTVGPITHVAHAIGKIDDSYLLRKDAESFAQVLETKTLSAINLDLATAQSPVALFATFSSIAAVIPNQGQADYAMGNAFLDHYADWRQGQVVSGMRSGRSLSLNLPLLAEGGIGVSAREQALLREEFGMDPLPSTQLIALFERGRQIANNGQSNLFGISGTADKIAHHLLDTLKPEQHVLQIDLHMLLTRDVRVMLADALGMPLTDIADDAPLRDFGLDSLVVSQLATRLSDMVNAKVSELPIFEAQAPSQLATALFAQHTKAFSAHYHGMGSLALQTRAISLIDPGRTDLEQSLFQRRITNQEFYMRDHILEGQFNVPGACYLEMARQAGSWAKPGAQLIAIQDTLWSQPLSSSGPAFDVYVSVDTSKSPPSYDIFTEPKGGARVIHATGTLIYQEPQTRRFPEPCDIGAILDRCRETKDIELVYHLIHAEGLIVGPTFMPMTDIHLSDGEALGRLVLPESVKDTWDQYLLHPTMLTGIFQVALIHNRTTEHDAQEFIPFSIGMIHIYDVVPTTCYVYCKKRGLTGQGTVAKFDLKITDEHGRVVMALDDFAIKSRKPAIHTHTHQPAEQKRYQRNADLEQRLRETIAPVLGFSADEIEADLDFEAYGVNSLIIIDLNLRMEEVFGAGLSKTLFFECRSLKELAEYMSVDCGENSVSHPQDHSSVLKTPRLKLDPSIAPLNTAKLHTQPIAIVGLAFKFPQADSKDAFWEILSSGVDCITDEPAARRALQVEAGIKGGYIDGIDLFDPLFFRITPREAASIDPQERLFLETSWHALEDAGYTRAALNDRQVGVYVGALWQPYVELGARARAADNENATSGLLYSIANRVSYVCGFTGPSLAVDTACSSSLTALHLACQSLHTGESDLALVGGVNLTMGETKSHFLAKNNFLSSDARCRSFGADGTGYVPGEGVATLVLQPLAAAQAEGRHIYGQILGSAINHGGKTNGYTVPSPKAQSALIQRALDKAGCAANQIDYVEAHGTGTELGDPIEIAALTETFRGSGISCAIGSVKSNIGHLEATAGLAGIIKVVMQMQNAKLVPSLHSTSLNPNIDFDSTPFQVQQSLADWVQRDGVPRRAAISSFGAGGSNAHVILEESPTFMAVPVTSGPYIVPVSAPDAEGLARQLKALRTGLAQIASADLPRLAYTLQTGRESHAMRCAFVVTSLSELDKKLAQDLNVAPPGTLASLLKNEPDLDEILARWHRNGEFQKLAEIWAAGVDVDWARYWAHPPQILSLPGYEFDRQSHWITLPDRATEGPKPIILSAQDLRFEHHRVAGASILSGAASLLLAWDVALQHGFGQAPHQIAIADVRWQSPIAAPSTDSLKLNVAIQDTAEPLITLSIQDKLPSFECRSVVASQTPTRLGITELIQQSERRWSKQQCYALFASHGLHYGASHQQIDTVYVTKLGLLVELSSTLGSTSAAQAGRLDSVFQASLLWHFEANEDASLLMPTAAAKVSFWAPLSEISYALLRENEGKPHCSIQLLGDDGTLLGELDSLQLCPQTPTDDVEMLLMPQWIGIEDPEHDHVDLNSKQSALLIGLPLAQETQARALFGHCVNVAAVQADVTAALKSDQRFDHIIWDTSAHQPDASARTDWRHTQLTCAILQALPTTLPLTLTIVLSQYGSTDPEQAAATALIQTAAKEHPNWRLRIVDISEYPQSAFPRLMIDTSQLDATTFKIDESGIYRRALLKFNAKFSASEPDLCLRPEGTYIVIGGAGGIGQAWTAEAIRRRNANIIWVGRSSPCPAIDANLDLMAVYGRRPTYICADASDPAALAELRANVIAQYGQIDGIVHAAMVLDNCALQRLSPERLDSTMQAKAGVSRAIEQVFDQDPPQLLLFLSSINAFATLPGQGNYSAACAYVDAHAHALATRWRESNIKVINWGYWGDVGAVAEPKLQSYMSGLGYGSIKAKSGLSALDMLMSSTVLQLGHVVLQPSNDKPLATVIGSGVAGPIDPNWYAEISGPISPLVLSQVCDTENTILDKLRQRAADWLNVQPDDVDPDTALEDLGFDPKGLIDLRMALDGSVQPKTTDTLRDLVVDKKPLANTRFEERSKQLTRALLREHDLWDALPARAPTHLHHWHAATREWLQDLDCSDYSKVEIQWQNELNQADAENSSRAVGYAKLTDQILPDLAAVLQGIIPPTQALFPQGSFDPVKRIYKDNQETASLNNQLARTAVDLLAHAQSLKGGQTLRILEIGAGTGSTTQSLLEQFDHAGVAPDEYCFTDLSASFLSAADLRFSHERPWFKVQIFDIEVEPTQQGLMPFDIVIAANVLHATSDIKDTLRHMKACLKPSGVLLLLELTKADWQNHITFGLLPGWWRAQDQLRLPHSPILSRQRWQEVLETAGFNQIETRASTDDEALALLAAVSDGITYQRGRANSGEEPRPVVPDVPVVTDDLTGQVQSILSETTGISVTRLNPEDSFDSYGVDSLVRVDMQAKLDAAFGSLPATLLFTHPSIAEVVNYLRKENRFLHQPVATIPIHAPEPETGPKLLPTSVVEHPSPQISPVLSGLASTNMAIIGMSGRFPMANSVDALWQRLVDRQNCAEPMPQDRWSQKTPPPYGGFLTGLDRFDHKLFGLTKDQANELSPEVRLFLEVVWDAFQNAGYGPLELDALSAAQSVGVGVGVFVASMYHQSPMLRHGHSNITAPHVNSWMIANRLSHLLNLTGPSMAIDTACSGSLTTIEMACDSLQTGRCSMAVAGGVNLTLLEEKYKFLDHIGFLSQSDASRSFGKGDGFLPGEGVAAVVLKPLHQAEQDGDRIDAVILGSGTRHSGGRQSFFAPDPAAQNAVMSQAIQSARLEPKDIDYIEAAANGSELSDAVEAIAIAEVFDTERDEPCMVGAVKSNLGHLEAASGISQLAKVVLQFRHETLVPTLFATPKNPHLSFASDKLVIQETIATWPNQGQPRRALINSFGAGGALASLVVEEYPNSVLPTNPTPQIFVFSARTPETLNARLDQICTFVKTDIGTVDLSRLSHTLQRLDSNWSCRLAIIAQDASALLAAMRSAQSDNHDRDVITTCSHEQSISALAEAWQCGKTVCWPHVTSTPLRLPPYPFDHDSILPVFPDAESEILQQVAQGQLSETEFLEWVLDTCHDKPLI